MATQEKNWAGNITYSAKNFHTPQSIEDLQNIVKQSSQPKVVGSRHSFNRIADTQEDLIFMKDLNQVVDFNPDERRVTIQGGMRYGELGQYLHEKGYALHNLASLPHISVVGAVSTATHGSGSGNQNLAGAVIGLEFIDGNGDIRTLSRKDNPDEFAGAVVGLGAIGIVTKMTLQIEPTYQVRQNLFTDLPLSEFQENFDAVMDSAYSVSVFTDWVGDTFNQVWLKQRVTDDTSPAPAELFGAKAATQKLHPVIEVDAESCTEQMGIAGAWHQRLPHFKLEFTPSHGEELQTEYFVPREHAVAGANALLEIADEFAPLLLISEIRAIAADDFWMSPCYQQDCIAFHFTWKPDWDSVKNVLPLIEKQLLPYNALPHWGKLFTLDTDYLKSKYNKWDDFLNLIQTYDPAGNFRNVFLNRVIFSG